MISQPVTDTRKLGVTFTADQQANVMVWVPQAKEVALSVNDHSLFLPLTKDNSGYWQLTTGQLKPGDTYTFILDKEKEWTDPTSLLQPQGVYGPSQAFDLTHFYWEDTCWVNPPIDEYIVYEIDIQAFTAEGTLNAIIHKLSHIRKLGVNAILIRPVTDFPDAHDRQQEAAFLFAVQASYGGPGQLQQLVNACHFEGMAVILDLSYKQSDRFGQAINPSGDYLARKQPIPTSKTGFSSETSRAAYQHYLVANALMWFRDFHIDALRLDNIYSLADPDQLLLDIRKHTNALTAQTGRQHYLLVEQDLTLISDRVKKANHTRTDGNSHYMDFNQNRYNTKLYRKDCLCDSTFSDILQELFDREADIVSDKAFLTVLQTYHQADEQSDQRIDSEFIKLIAGSIMVSPCIPTLFMGEEWGVTNPFRQLVPIESVSVETNYASLLVDTDSQPGEFLLWELLDELPNQTLYSYYQSLTELRRHQPALYHLSPNQAQVISQNGDSTILLHRSYKTNEVLCLMNFSAEKQRVTLPSFGKNWEKLLDSADPIWGGPGSSPETLPDAGAFSLHPQSIVVYKAST
ncbi:malto-oligosyltrehalose trehalohydrolase [Spirosoma harenae]